MSAPLRKIDRAIRAAIDHEAIGYPEWSQDMLEAAEKALNSRRSEYDTRFDGHEWFATLSRWEWLGEVCTRDDAVSLLGRETVEKFEASAAEEAEAEALEDERADADREARISDDLCDEEAA